MRSRINRSNAVRGKGRHTRFLRLEPLERRYLLAGDVLPGFQIADDFIATPMLVAGDPSVAPADSPNNRIDPNVTTSDYSGVGSLFMKLGKFNGYICTGTPINAEHVLTAAHCLDSNNDGTIDFKANKVEFNLNYSGNLSHTITASELFVHPEFTGFANPVVNDDIAIVRLSSPIPVGVPTYPLYDSAPVASGDTLEMVGYGVSGNGVTGYSGNASLTVKRTGANNADDFESDLADEGSNDIEVFLADFDEPTGSDSGPIGGTTLGNDVETTLGGGDSGGPSFVDEGGQLKVAGVNTFTFWGGEYSQSPLFGSGMGGILVYDYLDWLNPILAGGGGGGGDGDDGGGGGGGNGKGGGPPAGKGKNKSFGELIVIETSMPLVVEQDLETETFDTASGFTPSSDEPAHDEQLVVAARVLHGLPAQEIEPPNGGSAQVELSNGSETDLLESLDSFFERLSEQDDLIAS